MEQQPTLTDVLIRGNQTTRELLEAIERILRSQPESVAVSEKAPLPHLQPDFPFEGSSRWLLPRVASGGSFELSAAPATVLADNANRLGGTIVNAGEEPATLYLCDAEAAARPAGVGRIVLIAGGSWDLRLGNLLWCGSVSGVGEGQLAVVEV